MLNSLILASIFWADFKRRNYKEFYSGFTTITADFDKQNNVFLILERQKTFAFILFKRPQREIFKFTHSILHIFISLQNILAYYLNVNAHVYLL